MPLSRRRALSVPSLLETDREPLGSGLRSRAARAGTSSVRARRLLQERIRTHHETELATPGSMEQLAAQLDERQGLLLSSGFEYPGRHRRSQLGLVDPPLRLTSRGRSFELEALNSRGQVLLPAFHAQLQACAAVVSLEASPSSLRGSVRPPQAGFSEEERTRQPSVFSVVRALMKAFEAPTSPVLGFYGAFAYDLCFQVYELDKRLARPAEQRELVLYLPDEVLESAGAGEPVTRHRFEFECAGRSTVGLERSGSREPFQGRESSGEIVHASGDSYIGAVERAIDSFRRGDLYEVVVSRSFTGELSDRPSVLFERMFANNPTAYSLLCNLGEGEYLVGTSPEMFVRVKGRRVETCPISGTISRGADALEDAERIRTLLNSEKEASELTMCTDVDRNDKARVCEPGSVRVIGRRQIETYAHLIHTVDHIEGRLLPAMDSLDAFVSHLWEVTVTGAPKLGAMRFIEENEISPRRWYGGAFGRLSLNGELETGMTLSTVQVQDGLAELRVGSTMLHASEPAQEERETRLKASFFFQTLNGSTSLGPQAPASLPVLPCRGLRVLMIDHEDSFVQILANYVRQTGAEVITLKHDLALSRLEDLDPDLVLLSPGPGAPSEYRMGAMIAACLAANHPIFGVCLGLQGLYEFFGGRLAVLPEPMHGRSSMVEVRGGRMYRGSPERFAVGRYHSLYARRDTLPEDLRVTAQSEDGIIMGIEHVSLPVAAVQYHPESVMSGTKDMGPQFLGRVLRQLVDRSWSRTTTGPAPTAELGAALC